MNGTERNGAERNGTERNGAERTSPSLWDEEIAALKGEDVTDVFFAALARVQEIHANCRQLLRTHHQRAGLELMDVMAGPRLVSVHSRACIDYGPRLCIDYGPRLCLSIHATARKEPPPRLSRIIITLYTFTASQRKNQHTRLLHNTRV